MLKKNKTSGNMGYAKAEFILGEVRRLSETWFKLTETWLNGKDKGLKKVAYVELGKLVGKSMPTTITGEDGGPLQIKIIDYAGNSNTIQVPAAGLSTTVSTGDGRRVQKGSDSMAPQER